MNPSEDLEGMSRLNNELVNAHRDLHSKNRQLEALNREKNEAIGVLAHDLRNPLGLIKMCSHMLIRNADRMDPDDRELLQMIENASTSMAKMVNDVLDLSAIESGTLRLERRPVDFPSYVSRNVEQNRVLAKAKNVWIDYQPARDSILLEIDPTKFDQVLNNLLGNAVSFSGPGGHVDVRVFQDVKDAVVAIRDYGPGIPPGEVDKLFKPFVRGRQAQREGSSTGLGLAIVKRIVEGHGGRIGVESEPGRGATFSVRLPRTLPSTPSSLLTNA